MRRCPECGAKTSVIAVEESEDGLLTTRQRVCAAGHTSTTYEVTETVWATGRHRHEASLGPALRRWERAARDTEIVIALREGMRGKAAARKWGLTERAVSVIRNTQGS